MEKDKNATHQTDDGGYLWGEGVKKMDFSSVIFAFLKTKTMNARATCV